MSVSSSSDAGQRSELKPAKPMQRAYSSSVLWPEVRGTATPAPALQSTSSNNFPRVCGNERELTAAPNNKQKQETT